MQYFKTVGDMLSYQFEKDGEKLANGEPIKATGQPMTAEEYSSHVSNNVKRKAEKFVIPKRKTLKTLQKEVDDFNKLHPVGSAVYLRLDSGELKRVDVKHEATILGGHTSVGWFEGVSGCYNLSKVEK